MIIDNEYKNFCMKCSWNDCDFGCTCPSGEEVYQCPLYMDRHPNEVKDFENWIIGNIKTDRGCK